MKTLLQSAAVFALLSLGVGTAVVVWDEHKLAHASELLILDADLAARHLYASLSGLDGELDHEAPNIHSILSSAKDAAAQSSAFVTEQRTQLRKTSADSDHQVRALGLVTRNAETFFYNLDQNVNGKLLPDFDTELKATSMAAQFSMESMTHAGDALTFQLQDPEWGQTLHGFNVSAGNLALASASGASILAHGDHVAGYFDKQLTTPLGFWKTLGKTMLSVGSDAGNIYGGFFRPNPKP